MIFLHFSAFSSFPLHGKPILSSGLDSSSNITWIIVVRIFFIFFSDENDDGVSLPLFAQEEAENSKNRKIEKPL